MTKSFIFNESEKVFRVGPTAKYTTVQSAIDAAELASPSLAAPCVVLISAAKWAENVVIRKDHVHLIGTGGQGTTHIRSVTITNATAASITTFEASDDPADLVAQTQVGIPKNVQLRGIEIYRDDSNTQASFRFLGAGAGTSFLGTELLLIDVSIRASGPSQNGRAIDGVLANYFSMGGYCWVYGTTKLRNVSGFWPNFAEIGALEIDYQAAALYGQPSDTGNYGLAGTATRIDADITLTNSGHIGGDNSLSNKLLGNLNATGLATSTLKGWYLDGNIVTGNAGTIVNLTSCDYNGVTSGPGSVVIIGGSVGTLQDAYDGGNVIIHTATDPVQILAPSTTLEYNLGAASPGIVTEETTFKFSKLGLPLGGDIFRATIINDEVPFTCAGLGTSDIDFGAGINLLTQGHDVLGVNALSYRAIVVIKNTNNAPTNIGLYLILAFGNGAGTNSVATLLDLSTFTPASLTCTSGTVTTANVTTNPNSDFETQHIAGNNTTGAFAPTAFFNDGASLENVVVIENLKNGLSSGTALSGGNAGVLFVANTASTGSNVPLIRLFQLGDSADILFTNKASDPATVSEGSLWYNSTANVFKYYDGATVQTLSTGSSTIPTLFDAVVPTDYATISAAVAAGKTHIRVVSSVTEIADSALTIGEDYLIWVDQTAIVTCGDFAFTYTGNTNVILRGGGTLAWARPTVARALFENASFAGSFLDIDGLILTNTSLVASTPLAWCNQRIRNFTMTCGSGGIRGFATVAGVEEFYLDGGEIIGPSATCNQVISFALPSVQYRISNVRFTGTFAASPSYLFDVTGPVTFRDIVYEGSSVLSRLQGNVTVDGFVLRGASNFDFDIRNDYNRLLNLNQTSTGNIILRLDLAGDHNYFDNVYCNSVNLTGAVSNNNKFSNCIVETAVTVNPNRNSFVNCDFLGGVTVGGDKNRFSQCQFGTDAGGGIEKIDISALADGTTVVACYSDDTITDAGTGTQLVANTVY
jgi:hypothetical protein